MGIGLGRHEKVLTWVETGENEPLGLHEEMLYWSEGFLSTQGKYIRLIKKIGPGYGQPLKLSKGISRFGALRLVILNL